MSSSRKVVMMTVSSTASLSTLVVPAHAEPTGTAADLLPVKSQSAAITTASSQAKVFEADVSTAIRPEAHYNPELLRAAAIAINNPPQPEKESDAVDISDVIDLSFFEQFIDENGNIDLPLGITVFEAMGTTSIGFGGDFR